MDAHGSGGSAVRSAACTLCCIRGGGKDGVCAFACLARALTQTPSSLGFFEARVVHVFGKAPSLPLLRKRHCTEVQPPRSLPFRHPLFPARLRAQRAQQSLRDRGCRSALQGPAGNGTWICTTRNGNSPGVGISIVVREQSICSWSRVNSG